MAKSQNLEKIKDYLESEGFARIGDLVEITNVTKRTVSDYLKELDVKKDRCNI